MYARGVLLQLAVMLLVASACKRKRDQVSPSGHCGAFTSCYECGAAGCGWCGGAGCGETAQGCYNASLTLSDGDRVCQHEGDVWYPTERSCPDPCHQYSGSCSSCFSSLEPCGWCSDGGGCASGSPRGPKYATSSCDDWRFDRTLPGACVPTFDTCASLSHDCEACKSAYQSQVLKCRFVRGACLASADREVREDACPTRVPPTPAPSPRVYRVPGYVVLLMLGGALLLTALICLAFVKLCGC